MTVSFVRQVGHESNVQLNPLRDRSEMPTQTISDQVFGIMGQFKRGRIDRAFKVDASNYKRLLGEPSEANENDAYTHIAEALNNGAYEVVVSRLVPQDAIKNNWIVVKQVAPIDPEAIENYMPSLVYDIEFSAAPTLDDVGDDFLFAIKNNGYFIEEIAIKVNVIGSYNPPSGESSSKIYFELIDSKEQVLASYEGCLDPSVKDEDGNSLYLPDVIASLTDDIEVVANTNLISINSQADFYGRDQANQRKFKTSSFYFLCEGYGATLTPSDYEDSRKRLQYTPHNYFYLSSGGSQSINILSNLMQLAYDTNRQLRFDIDGRLTPDEAINFLNQLNPQGAREAHLIHAYWGAIKSQDPMGSSVRKHYGFATLNIAMSCARNAQKNAKGFAPKNYPIAGRDWPINRRGMVQTYTCSDKELSRLAEAKINVVCWEEYSEGGRFVYRDSITCAPVTNSLKKLIAVAEMAAHTDDAVTRFGKSALQKPMKEAVKITKDFLRDYFRDAQDSDWIVPANEPSMKGAAYRYHVAPSVARPYEEMVVSYDVRYDGTNRVTTVTQTLVK